MADMTEPITEEDLIISYFDGYYMIEIGGDSKSHYICIGCNSEQEAKIKIQQILDALELKREIDDIKANMKTSEYLYSGEFSKHIMDRISKIFGDKMIQ